jgi:hypothetical protein
VFTVAAGGCVINIYDQPPRRWIENTLPKHSGFEDLAATLSEIMSNLRQQDPDIILARRIIANTPEYLTGQNGVNKYAHAAWAFMTLRQDDDAWASLELIDSTGATFLQKNTFPAPVTTALIYTYCALRQRNVKSAIVGLQLAHVKNPQGQELHDVFALQEYTDFLSQLTG